ncbi:PspC domain-containing protein [Lactiplantibacillus modestisalitolerans]|uniref:PspC domain-containing protein n=1 Tax=Lactiplantibacillus modestisalitolerans TaxID=1457219 RepID=A0ABV5WSS4_9LACO|nr:PspC domain-containing protein [Lactiplantibacillus modestisalitolerans]
MKINLHRSSDNRVLAGVLGGIADHYDWNPNLIRVIYLVLSLTAFPGIIIYLVLWLLMKDPVDDA